ncbi:nuclear/nucleolar GTPase 2-like [Prunus avium]|uniref:Nuclear/nucleolar GTPase 2-like n=1 Tax=Prunus avium TaxID=42229 RepID=A0A6P5U2H9_PRUAV|nr:nuclear/nucleolar GTPase 2-like [Prunus avium]
MALMSTSVRASRNTRVASQQQLDIFREEHSKTVASNYNVILKGKQLPLSLLNDHQKQTRVHLLERESFSDAFGPKTKRKRPKLIAADYESLAKKADGSQDVFQQKHADDNTAEGSEGDGFRDLVRHTMFDKGQSKRIWGEVYKVIDSSDVVVQMRGAVMVAIATTIGSILQGWDDATIAANELKKHRRFGAGVSWVDVPGMG